MSRHTQILEDVFRPLCKDPDDADLVVESIQDVVDESLKVSLEPLLKKMVPIKFEDEEHEENGREYERGGSYWYSVSWPTKALLQWAIALDQAKRWAKVTSAPSVVRHLKPGAHPPTLQGPILKAFTDMVKDRLDYGVGMPRFQERDLVPDVLEEAILNSRGFQDKLEEDITHTDSNGEPYYEASSLEIHWAIEYAGDISVKMEEQGEKMRTVFTLPVNIRVRKFVAPGDYDYGRRSATMKITMGEVAGRLKKEPFRQDRRDQSYETRMASFYSLNIHQQRHTGTKKEQFLVVWYTGNPAHRWSSKTVDTLKDAVALANQVKPESDLATATEMGETPEGKLARRFLATFSRPGQT